jgi:hypothetical protein
MPIGGVITRANEIRHIWGHTQRKTFGVLRLLTAVAQDIERSQSQCALAGILKNQVFTTSKISA